MDELKDSRLGCAVYSLVLKVIRNLARLRRRLLGPQSPVWFQDLKPLVSPFGSVALLPTFIAVVMTPRHFFRRLPRSGDRPNRYAIRPLKFLLDTAFTVSVLVLLDKTFPDLLRTTGLSVFLQSPNAKRWALGIALFLTLGLPFWATISLFLIEFYFVFGGALALFYGPVVVFLMTFNPLTALITFFGILVANVIGPGDACQRARRSLLSWHIDIAKYVWGSCYCAISILGFATISSVVAVLMLQTLVVSIPDWSMTNPSLNNTVVVRMLATILPFGWIVSTAAGAYAVMIDECSTYPRLHFYASTARRLNEYHRSKGSWLNVNESTARRLMKKCIDETELAELKLRKNQALLEKARMARRMGLHTLVDVSPSFEKAEDLELVRKLIGLKDS